MIAIRPQRPGWARDSRHWPRERGARPASAPATNCGSVTHTLLGRSSDKCSAGDRDRGQDTGTRRIGSRDPSLRERDTDSRTRSGRHSVHGGRLHAHPSNRAAISPRGSLIARISHGPSSHLVCTRLPSSTNSPARSPPHSRCAALFANQTRASRGCPRTSEPTPVPTGAPSITNDADTPSNGEPEPGPRIRLEPPSRSRARECRCACTLSLSQLARESGLSKSTAHRVVGGSLAPGVVRRQGDGYRLGPPSSALTECPLDAALLEMVLPRARDLHRETGPVSRYGRVHRPVAPGTGRRTAGLPGRGYSRAAHPGDANSGVSGAGTPTCRCTAYQHGTEPVAGRCRAVPSPPRFRVVRGRPAALGLAHRPGLAPPPSPSAEDGRPGPTRTHPPTPRHYWESFLVASRRLMPSQGLPYQ
ncbi:hypothetical protein M2271_001037 [Streptomyces sp. LBL]|nr:hypothetical protein [Streptomyces sp. LBL]